MTHKGGMLSGFTVQSFLYIFFAAYSPISL